MAKQRWLIQVVIEEGVYDGAADLIEELSFLLDEQSEGGIEVVSAELDPNQEMSESC